MLTNTAGGRGRWLALGLAGAGLGMIPWLAYLAVSLPASPVAWHWRAAWTGLDAMEAAGLLSTGILLLRRDARAGLTAAGTAALLLADAWFDVTTAPPGSGALTSLLMAVLAELPAAGLCVAVAVRSWGHRPSGRALDEAGRALDEAGRALDEAGRARPAGRRPVRRPPVPVEQVPAGLAFERFELLSERGTGGEQPPGGPPEAQYLRHPVVVR